MLKPLPTSSSIYLHKNCIMTMNRQMRKVIMNCGKKVFNMNMYSFLMRNMWDCPKNGAAKLLQVE